MTVSSEAVALCCPVKQQLIGATLEPGACGGTPPDKRMPLIQFFEGQGFQEVFDSESFDRPIGNLAGFLEQEVIEHFASDHVTGRQIRPVGASEIDVDVDVFRTAEGDDVDEGAGKVGDLIEEAEFPKDGDGLPRQGVAADFIAGEMSLVEKQDAQARSLCVKSGRCTGRARTDNDQVVGSI